MITYFFLMKVLSSGVLVLHYWQVNVFYLYSRVGGAYAVICAKRELEHASNVR